jgi:hypothetical protein
MAYSLGGFLPQIPWHYAIIIDVQHLKNPSIWSKKIHSSVSNYFIGVVLLNSGFDW